MARVLCCSVSLLDSEAKRNKGDGVCRENIIMKGKNHVIVAFRFFFSFFFSAECTGNRSGLHFG